MFNNLKAEMARSHVTLKAVAKELGLTNRSMSYKLSGLSDFKSSEMFVIKNKFFPSLDTDYLFKKEN